MKDLLPTLRITGFPGRYLQGPGALGALGTMAAELGASRPVMLCDDVVDAAIGAPLRESLGGSDLGVARLRFAGECTPAAIAALAHGARELGADLVVGLGGGKTIDTAKGVAKALGARIVIAPTIASNDSATSRLIVLYDETHRLTGLDFLPRNPDVVLVDTAQIVKAPVRFFRAGIGDALSKTLETAQCMRAGGLNFFGGRPPATAAILSDSCYEIVRSHGEAAVQAVARRECTADVEALVEATVLLSGLGFESGGLSISHALIRGLSTVPDLAGALHGEMVTFGTVVQLLLEQRGPAEVARHLALLDRLGMQASLAALGRASLTEAELRTVAEVTVQAPYIGNFDRPVTADGVRRAILQADALGSGTLGGVGHST